MGDKDKEFKVTVTFTAPTGKTVREAITYVEDGNTKSIAADAWEDGKVSAVIELKHDATITFTNIPYDVTYTVAEDDYISEGYEVTYSNKEGTINAATTSTNITNDKGGTVDMGVALDSLPYVLMLAAACAGMFVFVSKKRTAHEN